MSTSTRVLAGPEAIENANRMRATIESGLNEQLTALEQAAARLSDPNVWDGPHAQQFRNMWHDIGPRLRQAQSDLAQMRHWIQSVADSILAAGGLPGA